MVTRRSFIAMGVTAVAAGVASCSSGSGGRSGGKPADLPRWFAKYSPADEPDADPSKVRWPDFVVEAGGDVRELYEFQLTHGDLMRYMPCFCGCGQNAGHRNNRDCYIKQVKADGSVVFDSMAPTWGVCLGVTRDVMRMLDQGKSPREIRRAIDEKYIAAMDSATPTPYPPA